MRKRLLAVAAVAVVLLGLPSLVPGAGASGPFTSWDQRNDGPTNFNSHNTASAWVAFQPTLPAVDTVQLCIAGEGSSQVRVHIRHGSDSGPILGTSDVTTTPSLPVDDEFSLVKSTLTFSFDTPVALTPGDTYVIDTEQVSGLSFAARAPLDPTNPVGGGGELWFREGVSTATPDASSLAAPTCP